MGCTLGITPIREAGRGRERDALRCVSPGPSRSHRPLKEEWPFRVAPKRGQGAKPYIPTWARGGIRLPQERARQPTGGGRVSAAAALSADGRTRASDLQPICARHTTCGCLHRNLHRPLRQQIRCRTFPSKPATCPGAHAQPSQGHQHPPMPPGENMGKYCPSSRAPPPRPPACHRP